MTGSTKFERVRRGQPASNDAPTSAKARAIPAPSAFIAPILLSDAEVAAALGVGLSKLHEIRHEPWFPRPITLGPKVVRWSRLELEAAVAHMPREAAGEPVQLLRARIERMKARGVPA